jgi:hypothetical protein
MFEREIQFIYDFSHNKIKKLGSFITFSELKSTNLHPAILQYISAEIDFYIFEDRQKLLKDSLFDYTGKKINSYFMLISEEIKKTKKFSQSYIEKLILHSVTFTVNHLVNPNTLISQFIFEEDNEKSAAEIKQILNYLYYYPHTKKIISSYLDKKNIMKISSEEFGELLKKIDSIGFAENPAKIYKEALESMSDFFNIGMSGRAMVPFQAVENYLKDKGLSVHIDNLKSEFVDTEITRYEIKDYYKILVGSESAEPHADAAAETEEVLESDLKNDSVQPHVFEPVEDEEQTVELKIKEEESPKVILDEETVIETEEESDDKVESTPGEKDAVTAEKNGETKPEAEIQESDAAKTNDQADVPAADPDIIEIDDERGLESETVAEVMELAKEEVNIITDENIEGKELIAEDDDDSLGVIDELDDNSAETEEKEELDTHNDPEREVEQTGTESKPMEEEQGIVENNKSPLGFNVSSEESEEKPGEVSGQASPDKGEYKSESDNVILTSKDPEKPGDDLSQSDSKDTLSYLLNDDPIETELNDNSFEVEEQDDQTENNADDEDLELFEQEKEDAAEKEDAPEEQNVIKEPAESPKEVHIDITSLLENRKITKVIDVIFDYDMEEFANTLEQISVAPNLDSANQIIDKVCGASQISTSSKEAKLFKTIISDYYDRK